MSESEIECLDAAIQLIATTTFDERTAMSHNEAWLKATNSNFNGEIDILDMASSAGASFEMLKYIETKLENVNTFTC